MSRLRRGEPWTVNAWLLSLLLGLLNSCLDLLVIHFDLSIHYNNEALTSALSSYSCKLSSTYYNFSFTSTISSSSSYFCFLISYKTSIYSSIYFLSTSNFSHSFVLSSNYPVIISALWVSSSNCLHVFSKFSFSTSKAFYISPI